MQPAPQSQGPVSSSTSKDSVELTSLHPGPLQPCPPNPPPPRLLVVAQPMASRPPCLSHGGASFRGMNLVFRVDVTLHIATVTQFNFEKETENIS